VQARLTAAVKSAVARGSTRLPTAVRHCLPTASVARRVQQMVLQQQQLRQRRCLNSAKEQDEKQFAHTEIKRDLTYSSLARRLQMPDGQAVV
jgi:hypothetical protein